MEPPLPVAASLNTTNSLRQFRLPHILQNQVEALRNARLVMLQPKTCHHTILRLADAQTLFFLINAALVITTVAVMKLC